MTATETHELGDFESTECDDCTGLPAGIRCFNCFNGGPAGDF